eukprot:1939624-Prymnesium_polylepis.1
MTSTLSCIDFPPSPASPSLLIVAQALSQRLHNTPPPPPSTPTPLPLPLPSPSQRRARGGGQRGRLVHRAGALRP